MKNNKKGFTIIELLVVIAIIGLLATLAVVSLRSAQVKARDTKRVADMKQIQTAIELYYSDEGFYPSPADWDDFTSDISEYMSNVPDDPKNTGTQIYTYLYSDAQGSADEYVLAVTAEDLDEDLRAQSNKDDHAAGGTQGGAASDDTEPTGFSCIPATTYCLTE